MARHPFPLNDLIVGWPNTGKRTGGPVLQAHGTELELFDDLGCTDPLDAKSADGSTTIASVTVSGVTIPGFLGPDDDDVTAVYARPVGESGNGFPLYRIDGLGGGISSVGIGDVEGLADALDAKLSSDSNMVYGEVQGTQIGEFADTADEDLLPLQYRLVHLDDLDLGRSAKILAQNYPAAGTGGVVNSAAAEAVVDSLTIPHAELVAHDVLEWVVAGTILNNSGATRIVPLKAWLDDTLLVSGSQSLVVPGTATDPYRFEVALKIHLPTLASQRVHGTLRYITAANAGAAASVAALATYVAVREALAEDLSAADKTLTVTTLPVAHASLAVRPVASSLTLIPGT